MSQMKSAFFTIYIFFSIVARRYIEYSEYDTFYNMYNKYNYNVNICII